MAPEDEGCHLCDLPLEASAVTDDEGRSFCCRGCRDVHGALGDVSVDSAEAAREALDTGEGDEAIPDHHERAYLRVEGMHCATCELFIESRTRALDGVSGVEASYVTETVRVDYDPEVLAVADLTDRLSAHGYTAFRRGDDRARREAEDRTEYRLIAGVVVGMVVMMHYFVLLYPVHFSAIYGATAVGFLEELVSSQGATYFYVFLFVLTTVVFAITGGPLVRGAYVSLRSRQPNMDLLVTLAAGSAYVYSVVAVLLGRIDVYFDVTVGIVLVVSLGAYYERRMKREATGRLSELTRAHASEATLFADGEPGERVDLDALSGGECVLVREGERIPVDGTVREGTGSVDEAVVTGESLPVGKTPGGRVVGGSILTDGSLVIEVAPEAPSSVERVSDLVWDLQSTNHGIQRLANRLATVFVPAVVTLAALAAAAYVVVGAGPTAAMLVGLTVLIVSCPCALGLATPLAVASSIRAALDRSIVVFDDTVFERLRTVDVVAFDKTGTLTTGEMQVVESDGSEEAIADAAALEARASHPIARAITRAFDGTATAGSEGGDRSPAADGGVAVEGSVGSFESYAKGVGGVVGGRSVLVGHPDLFVERGWTIPGEIESAAAEHRSVGHLPVLVGRDGRAEAVIVLGDEPRSRWDDVVSSLSAAGIEVVVLTGDDEPAATYFEDHDGVDRVFAGVPPEGKAETVRRLSASGQTAMVGDGTNDAPALASADLGIALGSGTALAADAADVAIVDDDLASVETVFELAEAANARVKQNVAWAFLYNAVAIPLAVAGLLNPLFAAVAMATSSILVVANSSRPLLPD